MCYSLWCNAPSTMLPAEGGVEIYLYPFMTMALEGGEGVSVTPRPIFTPGKDPVPIVEDAGWVPGPVWTGAENIAPTPGFDPRTVQPVASRYIH